MTIRVIAIGAMPTTRHDQTYRIRARPGGPRVAIRELVAVILFVLALLWLTALAPMPGVGELPPEGPLPGLSG
jgi:hypothetical protein